MSFITTFSIRHETAGHWKNDGFTYGLKGELPEKSNGLTLPKTNSSHLKMEGWNSSFFWAERKAPAYFQGRTVSFLECKSNFDFHGETFPVGTTHLPVVFGCSAWAAKAWRWWESVRLHSCDDSNNNNNNSSINNSNSNSYIQQHWHWHQQRQQDHLLHLLP